MPRVEFRSQVLPRIPTLLTDRRNPAAAVLEDYRAEGKSLFGKLELRQEEYREASAKSAFPDQVDCRRQSRRGALER